MEEFSLQRIRDLIIAAHIVHDDGYIGFDTAPCSQLGYTNAEIEEAKSLLAAEQAINLQEYYKSQIEFCYVNPGTFSVQYVGYAGIIFVVMKDKARIVGHS